MCIEWIKKKICGQPTINIPPPDPLDDITQSEIYTILRAEVGVGCAIYFSDMNYKTTTKEELQRFLSSDNTDLYNYVTSIYDCDDFSYRLMGNLSVPGWSALPFGIFWSGTPQGGHAVNIFIDVNREVWIVEPQNDVIYKLPSDWTPWLVVM